MKKATERVDADPKVAPALEISTIRGMCRGISTDVPNDVERAPTADDLITSKTATRLASVKHARKITLDNL